MIQRFPVLFGKNKTKHIVLQDRNTLAFYRSNCPICQSTGVEILLDVKQKSSEFLDFLKIEKFNSKTFYESYFSGLLNELKFKIVKCKNCSFIFQADVLNEAGMSLLYNDWLDQELLLNHYSKQKPNRSQESMLKIIKIFYKNKSGINVLDFGAGYGNFCSLASNLGFNTYAFDLSQEKNSHLAGKLKVNVISEFDQYRSYFDFICLNQVLEHVSNPAEILINLKNCLSDHGIIHVSVPNCKQINKTIRRYGLSKVLFDQISPHQHINAFTNKTLKLLGSKTGLQAFSPLDFVKLFNWKLNLRDLKFLLGSIKKASFGTSLFFSRKM